MFLFLYLLLRSTPCLLIPRRPLQPFDPYIVVVPCAVCLFALLLRVVCVSCVCFSFCVLLLCVLLCVWSFCVCRPRVLNACSVCGIAARVVLRVLSVLLLFAVILLSVRVLSVAVAAVFVRVSRAVFRRCLRPPFFLSVYVAVLFVRFVCWACLFVCRSPLRCVQWPCLSVVVLSLGAWNIELPTLIRVRVCLRVWERGRHTHTNTHTHTHTHTHAHTHTHRERE